MVDSRPSPSNDELKKIFLLATKIKIAEERLRSGKLSGVLPSRMMLYSPRGQDLIPACLAAVLKPDDYVVTTYRGLHDHIGKGVDLHQLFAEFFGKDTGTCHGKGGPMHVTDVASGLLVTTGVVGSGLPIANGIALACQMRGQQRVTVVNFGDGASNIGAFHESLNLASLWRLPVVFVCQNNLWAEHTRLEDGTTVRSIADRGSSYSMPAIMADGNDVHDMYAAAHVAVNRARNGEGPTLLEARTYKFYGHIVGDPAEEIPKEERAQAIENDPVPRLRRYLILEGLATEDELAGEESEIRKLVDRAIKEALEDPSPAPESVLQDVYSD
jgi:TPP-dependent pyruvate/acetoin dehydrogenase alpha subunit